MPTYRTVLNVPSTPWAHQVIDRGIDLYGTIIVSDTTPDDWNNRNMTDGRLWTFMDRALKKQHPAEKLPPPPPPPPPPLPTGIEIFPGTNIQSEVNAEPAGTVFILKAGTHGNQTIAPKPNNEFHGEAAGTVLNGNDITERCFAPSDGSAAGVVVSLLRVRGYTRARFGVVATATNVGWQFLNLEVHHNLKGAGIQHHENALLQDCFIHHNGTTGILSGGGSDGSIVERCEVSYNNFEDKTEAGYEAGGSKWLGTSGMTVRDCWFHHNHDNGIWFDWNNDNIIIEDNIVEDNLGNGIFYEVSYGTTIIRRNVVRRNQGRQIRFTSSSDVEIHDNDIIAEDGASGIYASDSDRGDPGQGEGEIRNLYVHHNRITTATGIAAGLRDNKGTQAVWGAPANNRFNHNEYVVGDDEPFFWEGNTRKTWAEWQAYGQDLDSTLVQV